MVSSYYVSSAESQRDQAVRHALDKLESAVFFILLLFFSGAVVGLLFTNLDDPTQENPMARLLWYPIYLVIALLVARNIGNVVRLATFSPLIVLCVLYCGISYFWSWDPGITMRRTIALLLTTLAGLVIAARYDWHQMVQMVAALFAFLSVLTLFVCLLMPSKGIMHEIYPGAWSGPWVEKNYMGGYMTRGLIAAMCAFAMRPDRYWIWVPTGLLCFGLVLMSTSKTALLVCLACMSAFIALRIFRRLPVLRVPLLYVIVMGSSVLLIALLAFPEEMFGLIGKDPSLTGRTDIWDALFASIQERFWQGYGYGVYWQEELGPSYAVRKQLEWGVPTAHNGWIESWLSAGIGIVILFGLTFVFTLLLAVNRMKHGGVETYWAVLFLISFLMFSVSESTILAQNDLSWVLFVATSAKLFAFERPYWRNKASHPYFRQWDYMSRA